MRAVTVVGSVLAYLTTPRSPHWPAVRRAHLMRESECQWCGADENLDVHHVQLFHERPDLELVDSNLITMCMSANRCHWLRAHMGKSWLVADPDIRRKCEEHKRKES